MMREKTMKGWVHLALATLAVYEAQTSTTNARRIVNGAATGWHLYSAYDHFFIEEERLDNE
jgi:hypothetical protein